ncbi:hypothetical protein ACFY2R_02345 [Micromonospora olivasterospora]|uniref:DUF4352 domain-containing protein n=1 Tax=Micromonospora olivasterospora TaxID=1880 RepID=A0A562IBB3_MICOL|nr:DUF4352 domain-containing protein [Micromonospora olivasterospora]TWH68260.1 hypothetical protein JD77_03251 [Micromonospora olivasterospora]
MSHPQPPYGPQDPYQPNQEPPTAPMPQYPAEQGGYPPPAVPQPPVSGSPYPPPAPGPPYPQQPPVSGSPYQPPVSGSPYPPTSGAPYPAGAPGFPPGPAQPPKSNKKPIIIIAVVAAVLALLCCIGGVVALVKGASDAAEEAKRDITLPTVTTAPSDRPTPKSSSSSPASGETFNMAAGDTLVITDDDGTLEITVLRFRTTTKGCKSYSPEPDKGLYLTAEVTATVTKGNMSINPFYFQWVAADGTTANGIAGALAGCGDLLDSGVSLREGSKRTGVVTFDVADKNGVLEYRHKLETAGSWKP